MNDYKKLSKNAFNIQASTYDADKNGYTPERYTHIL